jgi:hypothetical protein
MGEYIHEAVFLKAARSRYVLKHAQIPIAITTATS